VIIYIILSRIKKKERTYRWLRRVNALGLRAFRHHRSITWCSWPQS